MGRAAALASTALRKIHGDPDAKARQFSIRHLTNLGLRPPGKPRLAGAQAGSAPYTAAMRAPFRIRPPGSPSTCAVPDPLPISQALAGHDALARLGRLLHESKRRMAVVAPALPGALSRFIKPGPVDEEGWSLIAANAAVAAKLRHLQPRLEELLAEQGIQPHKVRIKVEQQG